MPDEGVAGVRLLNLTPHPVVVAGPAGRVELPPQGLVRVVDRERAVSRIGPVEVVEVEFGDVDGLPDPVPGVLLVVSRVVALARPGREDLLFPYGEIRDPDGRIEAVRALARVVRAPVAVPPDPGPPGLAAGGAGPEDRDG